MRQVEFPKEAEEWKDLGSFLARAKAGGFKRECLIGVGVKMFSRSRSAPSGLGPLAVRRLPLSPPGMRVRE